MNFPTTDQNKEWEPSYPFILPKNYEEEKKEIVQELSEIEEEARLNDQRREIWENIEKRSFTYLIKYLS